MADGYGFLPEAVTLSNLGKLSEHLARVSEQRSLEIADIAHSAADFALSVSIAELGVTEALSLLGESLSLGSYDLPADTLDDNLHTAREEHRLTSFVDKARFTELFTQYMTERGCTLREGDFLGESADGERFTYVKNQFSDEAYDVFSEEFRDPRVRYSANFRKCAQALADGEVDYILLPLEERGGVRLPSVAEIIYRYDFKINSVTPVFGYDAGADLKYALISKHFRVSARHRGDDCYLELRLPMSEEARLNELLSVSSYLGMTVYRVNTMTLDTEGETVGYFSLTLRDGGRGFTELFVYLLLFASDIIPVGIYKNLE